MDDAQIDSSASPFGQVPIEITISVGKAHPKIKELLQLEQDAVLQLDRRIEDPVELYVGDRLIARGELQELEGEQEGQLAVRLTEVVDLKDSL
ncbi:FliM/FliN family flagellar motor switch protein [Profundibacter sp.]